MLFVYAIALAYCGSTFVSGFAYAPNFITKIIEEETNVKPQGLLVVDSGVDPSPPSQTDSSSGAATSSHIRTRFPPEPNGYLHLGHAKAITFNFAVSRMFGGTCNLRMDDTNPSKEDKEYVDSITEDVNWIQSGLYEGDHVWDGEVRKTSSYFDFIYNCTVALIRSGDAYVDSLTADEMREYRGTLTEPGKDSPYRNRSVDENLELFEGMRNGDYRDGEHVVRAKIAMDSPNINLRDPTLYRIKHESHPETGDKWCIYPMYDFSHPIADAVEKITHSLCTLEFEDHRPFYDWTIEKLHSLGLLEARPRQIEFSRLNIQSTVLSKRKLIQLVQGKHVSGWDDPRLPTLSGMRRRGFPPAALRLFCERVGISKADSNIDFSVLEDCVRETMDASSPRIFAVLQPLKMTITNWPGGIEYFEADRHPKDAQMGKRTIPFGESLYIERSDFFDTEGPEGQATGGQVPRGFKRLTPNSRVRLRYAYVVECQEILRDPATNEPIELKCKYLPETRAGNTPEGMARVKGIVHWVEASTAMKATVNQYDRLFKEKDPGKDSGDFLLDLNPQSLEVLGDCYVEPSVCDDRPKYDLSAHQSLSYQFERNGYFAVDKLSDESSLVFNRVVTLRDTWNDKGKEKIARKRGDSRSKGHASSANNPVEDVLRVAFRAGTILSAEQHPQAENLLVCSVDCGDTAEDGATLPPRTVVAGLAGKISVDKLTERKVVVVTNLKPAKMRGIESTAMLLAATNENDDVIELLNVPKSLPNGYSIQFEGKGPSQPDAMLKSKGALKAWERAKSCLRIGEDGEAIYADQSGNYKMVTEAGAVKTETLKNVQVG